MKLRNQSCQLILGHYTARNFTTTITMGQLSFHDSTNVPSRQYKFTFTMKIKQDKTSAADRQIMDNKKTDFRGCSSFIVYAEPIIVN